MNLGANLNASWLTMISKVHSTEDHIGKDIFQEKVEELTESMQRQFQAAIDGKHFVKKFWCCS